MSEVDYLYAAEVELGHVVYLVEDCDDGPRRTAWCERGERGFTGQLLGDVVVEALRLPEDGRRVETLPHEPPFRALPEDWDEEAWLDRPWLILDTETTGLDDAKIVELGAVVMREGRVLAHRAAMYNPGKPIDPRASEVHGITDAMVRGLPRINERDPRSGRLPVQGLDALAAEYDCRAIVGYNLLTFDLPILRRELGHRFDELEAGVGPVVDALVVVRLDSVGRFWKGQGRHKLTAVAERLGLTDPEPGMKSRAHRAAWDCVLCGRILWHLREHLPRDASAVRELMRRESSAQQASFESWRARQPAQGQS